MAHDLRVGDRVRFLGNQDDVPAFLRSLDLFALASKFEPYGVALLEAKAAGLPIVATAVNEIPNIITDGESGVLTPPENPAYMASAFAALARNACRGRPTQPVRRRRRLRSALRRVSQSSLPKRSGHVRCAAGFSYVSTSHHVCHLRNRRGIAARTTHRHRPAGDVGGAQAPRAGRRRAMGQRG
jgi:hypothetical protein